MSVQATLHALADRLAVLRSYAASTISFGGNVISDLVGAGLAIFEPNMLLTVAGSLHNDGVYTVATSSAGVLTVVEPLVTEPVGAAVTLTFQPTRVYPDPMEATSLGDFPAIVLCLAPVAEHAWKQEAMGLSRHDYTVGLYVFLGSRNTDLAELHARVLPWPDAIGRKLIQDLTLGGTVMFLGYPSDNRFFTYQIGPIEWADGTYFGIKAMLPVTEKTPVPMG